MLQPQHLKINMYIPYILFQPPPYERIWENRWCLGCVSVTTNDPSGHFCSNAAAYLRGFGPRACQVDILGWDTVDGRNPANHLRCIVRLVNNGMSTTNLNWFCSPGFWTINSMLGNFTPSCLWCLRSLSYSFCFLSYSFEKINLRQMETPNVLVVVICQKVNDADLLPKWSRYMALQWSSSCWEDAKCHVMHSRWHYASWSSSSSRLAII